MIQFNISAPNKLSLFGEHAVNYGKTGLTIGIDLRTTLSFMELPYLYSEGVIQMECPQIDLYFSMPLQLFRDFYRNYTLHEDNTILQEQILQFFLSNYSHSQGIIVRVFFNVLVYMARKEQIDIKSFYVLLSTQSVIDASVCLGSAAVCFAACFLHWSHLQKGDHDSFDDSDLKKIYWYAASCKKSFSESGIADTIVCTYGLIVEHKVESNSDTLFRVINIPNLKLLLVDSKLTQNLEAQTQQVTELVNRNPELAHSILNNIGIATDRACSVFRTIRAILADNTLDIETAHMHIFLQHNILMDLINANQQLLNSLNVSHFHLDVICSILRRHGVSGKYTDIGGGRYAYVWCPPNMSSICIVLLLKELKRNGFDVIEINMSYSGVRIE